MAPCLTVNNLYGVDVVSENAGFIYKHVNEVIVVLDSKLSHIKGRFCQRTEKIEALTSSRHLLANILKK